MAASSSFSDDDDELLGRDPDDAHEGDFYQLLNVARGVRGAALPWHRRSCSPATNYPVTGKHRPAEFRRAAILRRMYMSC